MKLKVLKTCRWAYKQPHRTPASFYEGELIDMDHELAARLLECGAAEEVLEKPFSGKAVYEAIQTDMVESDKEPEKKKSRKKK